MCGWRWGGHACALPAGHDGDHVCRDGARECSRIGRFGHEPATGLKWDAWNSDAVVQYPRTLPTACASCGSAAADLSPPGRPHTVYTLTCGCTQEAR